MKFIIDSLYVTGVNFHKSDVEFRSNFSLDSDTQLKFLRLADEKGFKVQVLLSTCNRCEIYGFGNKAAAEKLLCEITGQSIHTYQEFKFAKEGERALKHIFNVASGLDSQILGDNEILGQFRRAFKQSKKYGLLEPLFERISNTAIQTAKEVRSKTDLSKGTSSVSYAVVDHIKKKYGHCPLKTLVIGMGKFGHSTVKNILSYFPQMQVSICNRTDEKAIAISKRLNIGYLNYFDIPQKVKEFDVVVLCANASHYIIEPEYLAGTTDKLVLDLSVPRAADPSMRDSNHIEFYDVDDISAQLNRNLKNREQYLPEAMQIISANLYEFKEWYKVYLNKKKIKKTKEILQEISIQCPYMAQLKHEAVGKSINSSVTNMVMQIRSGKHSACDVLQTVNSFLELNRENIESNN